MEDFNIPSAERVALLVPLQEAMGGAPPYFWAACQVCDLKALETLVEVARISPAIVRILAQQCHTMVRYWSPHPRKESQSSTPRNSDSGSPATFTPPRLSRSSLAKSSAKERDKHCCVLTGDGMIDVAHIYPFHSITRKEEDVFGLRHMFWDHLKNFWPQEKVTAWEAELFPAGIDEMGVERVYNLVSLSASAHKSWDQGAFALKPISVSDDNTTLKVQFFWQRKQEDTEPTMSLLTTPFSTKDLAENVGAYSSKPNMLFDFLSGERIKSGQFFELRTDDATTRPLPSFQLLEMQWFLQRIAGMAGAAFPPSYGSDYDSDEEVSNLGLDEFEESFGSTDPEDSSFVSTDPGLLPSQQVLHHDLGSKHHTEEVEEDGAWDVVRESEVM